MPRLYWKKHTLQFKQPSGTSRGVLRTKDSWFLIYEDSTLEHPAVGEISLIEGLSPDDPGKIPQLLDHICSMNLEQLRSYSAPANMPAVQFGLETLLSDIQAAGSKLHNGPTGFTAGDEKILINGLIWMGAPEFMKRQIQEKIVRGFKCIKLKIGAIDFKQELALLEWIRDSYPTEELELRVDANGAFAAEEAAQKLEQLSAFDLHSIEQPIAPNQWEAMASLCASSPIPIALDEELIAFGDHRYEAQEAMLQQIKPQYIILKPSLIGGLKASQRYIDLAQSQGIGWWLTSALESNVGLNAITQFSHQLRPKMPQGLGTGGLYTNNIESPLYIQGQFIGMHPENYWDLTPLTT